jgi:hypothetical protein
VVHGEGEEFVYRVISLLMSNKMKFREIKIEQPNLEDVFLALTGEKIRE